MSILKFKPEIVMTNIFNHETLLPVEQNNGVFCLHYVYCNKFDNGANTTKEMHDFVARKFVLPEGMSVEDAFKVLSYLAEYVEKKYDLEECSATSVQCMDRLLEKFYFTHIEPEGETPFRFKHTNNTPCTHLFTVNGRFSYFKRSYYAEHYFEWFTEGVTRDEVDEIYAALGLKIDLNDNETSSQHKI